jgi:ABC-type polysaccharide transport system permease subunit
MFLPAALVFFLFAYLPMPGIIIAFKDYNFRDGIFGSPFIGLKNFAFFFNSDKALSTTLNTLWINFNNILWGTVIAVTFAILLNEVRHKGLKKVYQNLMFLPYFISAVVLARFVYMVFATDGGLANQLLTLLGQKTVNWYNDASHWVGIIVGANIWKSTGYAVIIYLAAITGIDHELYESASLDGANHFQQIWYITLPLLVPTIIILTLLAIGRIFFGDFQTIYAIVGENGRLLPTTDIIETYVFRSVRNNAEFAMASAVGLFQSVVGFLLIFFSNQMVRFYNKDYSLF